MYTEVINNPNGSFTETDFDELENQIEVRDFDGNGEIVCKIKYDYDENLELTGWEEFRKGVLSYLYKIEGPDGERVVNVYDADGVLRETTPL